MKNHTSIFYGDTGVCQRSDHSDLTNRFISKWFRVNKLNKGLSSEYRALIYYSGFETLKDLKRSAEIKKGLGFNY